jgi:hypothetical protein
MFTGDYSSPTHLRTQPGICEIKIFPADQVTPFLYQDLFAQGHYTYSDLSLSTTSIDFNSMEMLKEYLPSAKLSIKNKAVAEGTLWTTELSFTYGGEALWEFLRTIQDREWIILCKLNSGNYLLIGSNKEGDIERGAEVRVDFDSGNRGTANATEYKFVWESSFPPIDLTP